MGNTSAEVGKRWNSDGEKYYQEREKDHSKLYACSLSFIHVNRKQVIKGMLMISLLSSNATVPLT